MSRSSFRLPVIIILILLSSLILVYADVVKDIAESDLAKMRNTKTGALQLLQYLKTELSKNPESYDLNWQYAAMCYFYADYYLPKDEKELKKKLFTLTKKYAQKAVNIKPNGVEGHYWLGVGIGLWSEANGILDSLFNADDVVMEMTKVIQLEPTYFRGTPWIIRAKVYNLAPGWPLSIGDKQKSYEDAKIALQYGSNYRVVYVQYVDILINDKKWNEALKYIEKGLEIPFDQNIPIEEKKSIEQLKNFKKIVEKNIK